MSTLSKLLILVGTVTHTAECVAHAIEFDQPIVWDDALIGQFYLDGAKDKVASGTLTGNMLTLKLRKPSTETKITYLKESEWSQDKLVIGVNGIAAFSFCDVPVVNDGAGQ